MVKKEMGTLKVDSIKAIVAYFSKANSGKASDIGVSGSLMSSLVARGYVKIIDTESAFICVNENRQTYQKVEVNIYALTVTPAALYAAYCESVEKIVNTKKERAEALIGEAKAKLTEAEMLLGKL
jgi:hypothetical protein